MCCVHRCVTQQRSCEAKVDSVPQSHQRSNLECRVQAETNKTILPDRTNEIDNERFSPHRGATNTNRRPLMSESYTLPTKPEGIVATLRERFNSGKVSAMMGLYAPEAVFIAKDGRTITDHAEIAAELERDLKLGLPLEAKARHVFVADDIA